MAFAAGLLTADPGFDTVKTAFETSDSVETAKWRTGFAWLADHLLAQFAADGLNRDPVGRAHASGLRQVGKGFELRIAFPDGPIDDDALADAWRAFQRQHRAEYGHIPADSPIETVNIRLAGTSARHWIGQPPPTATGTLEAARPLRRHMRRPGRWWPGSPGRARLPARRDPF